MDDGEGGRRSGIAGLQSCGSPWACPVCARKIAAERATDVARVLTAVADAGGCAALVTLTMRHRPGMPLRGLWRALSASWDAATSGGGWKRDRGRYGVLGQLRTVECTHGENGWHLHVHAIVCFDGPLSVELMGELAEGMFERWRRALERKGMSAVADKGGLDVRPVDLGLSIETMAEYITKAAFEVTSPSTKDGRYGNRAPFAILRDALATGLADDCELWTEWEQASHNRRQLTWSRGLREWAKLGREQSDEEIVARDLHGEDAIAIAPESWNDDLAGDIWQMLDLIETDGVAAGMAWLSARGARWWVPEHRARSA